MRMCVHLRRVHTYSCRAVYEETLKTTALQFIDTVQLDSCSAKHAQFSIYAGHSRYYCVRVRMSCAFLPIVELVQMFADSMRQPGTGAKLITGNSVQSCVCGHVFIMCACEPVNVSFCTGVNILTATPYAYTTRSKNTSCASTQTFSNRPSLHLSIRRLVVYFQPCTGVHLYRHLALRT